MVILLIPTDGSTKSFPSVSRLHPARCADIGVFSLGSPLADLQALRYIRHRYSILCKKTRKSCFVLFWLIKLSRSPRFSCRYGQRSDDVVVSGSGLPVFAAVARLLSTGVAPTRITVVVKEDEGFIEGLTEKSVSYIHLCLHFV